MAKRYNASHTPLSAGLIFLSFALIVGSMGFLIYSSSNTSASQIYSDINNAKYGFFSINPNTYQGRFFIACLMMLSSLITTFASSRIRIKHAERIANESSEALRRIAESNEAMTAQEFLGTLSKANGYGDSSDFTGVYVIYNSTKDAYYVGQSVHVLQRVAQHLNGHGNGDVYADYKYGDNFTIRLIPLVGSGYLSLNDLERDMIEAFDAYKNGYNKTEGNRT